MYVQAGAIGGKSLVTLTKMIVKINAVSSWSLMKLGNRHARQLLFLHSIIQFF